MLIFNPPHHHQLTLPEHYNFQSTDSKEISATLTRAYCGICRGSSSKLWSFCISIPSCLIEKLFATGYQGTTNDSFVLIPDFYNDQLGSDFNAFLHHMEGYSKQIKQKLLEEVLT